MRKCTYGVVGCGVVGTSIVQGLDRNNHNWWAHDLRPITGFLFDNMCLRRPDIRLLKKTDAIYLALPTPVSKEGGYCLKAILHVLKWLTERRYQGIVIIVSTIGPSDFKTLHHTDQEFDLVVSPEFLTAANAKDDWYEQRKVLYGHSDPVKHPNLEIEDALRASRSPLVRLRYVPPHVAPMIKTWRNVALATKLVVANMIYADTFLKDQEVDPQVVVDLVFDDPRLGDDYHKVGNDNNRLGFAGSCLPKDLLAKITDPTTSKPMVEFLREVDAFNEILQSIITTDDILKHFPVGQKHDC